MATTPVMKIVPPYTPELMPSVQRVIKQFLAARGTPRILEVGSGWSTLWFRGMGCGGTSIEHDEDWYDEVNKVCQIESVTAMLERDLVNAHQLDWSISQERVKSFDLALIDCIDEQRLPCLFASLTKVKDDGWLVLDDSHWEIFTEVPAIMARLGYTRLRFSGQHTRKTGEVKFHQTDIYCKKGFQ